MPNNECRLFIEELEDIERLTVNATFEDIPKVLQRWFYTLDQAPEEILRVSTELNSLTALQAVHDDMIQVQDGIGNNRFDWPLGKEERISAQHVFLRSTSETGFDFVGFISSFYYETHGNLNDANYNFVSRLFEPYVREFVRYIEMRLDGEPIPASDRIVAIDHNSMEFSDIDAAFSELEISVAASNSIKDKEMVQAELAAGRKLLEAPKARVSLVRSIVIKPLKHLAKAVGDNILGVTITALLTLIAGYFGVTL